MSVTSAFKRSRALLDNNNRVPRHLLKVLEAGVGLEGLPERDTGLFAEVVVPHAAGGKGGRIDE